MDVKLKPYKKDLNFSYAIGVYNTIELLTHQPDKTLKVLLHSQGYKNKGIDKIREICQKHQIKTEMADGFINKISQSENNYAVGVFQKYTTQLSPTDSHIVLVEPRDTGNLGTIIRTALGYNLENLAIIRPAVDIFSPKAIRASMGSLFNINHAYFDSYQEYFKSFPTHHQYPFMTDGKKSLTETTFEMPFSLVFGSESTGLRKEFEKVGTPIKIPQSDKIDSLNLSVAVGIAAFMAGQHSNMV